MFSVIKSIRMWGYFLAGMMISVFANGDLENINEASKASIENLSVSTVNPYVAYLLEENTAFLKDIEKALADKPFLKITCSNINDLCSKVLKLVEKIYPEMSSILSLSLTSFIGGTQCPGEEGTSPVYIVLFFHEGQVSPVFFFKSSEESPLFKAVSSFKKDPIDFIKLPAKDAKQLAWWMCGEKALLKVLHQKDFNVQFPFLATAETIDSLLQVDFDGEIIHSFEDLMPFIGRQLFEVFIKPEFKHFRLSADYLENNIVMNYDIEFVPNSATSTLIKGMNSRIKQVRHLEFSSQECIKNLGFQDYESQLTYFNVLHTRLNDLSKMLEESKKQTKEVDESLEVVEQLIAWENIIYPLITELGNFCKDNLTGNFQSYADVQCSKDFHYETIGFGLFEGKDLSNEKLVNFLKNFITGSLTERLKEAIKQKLVGSDLIPALSCVFNKNLELYQDCYIQNIYWTIAGNNSDKKIPLYFAVCKNYLLYADNIDNIKRLIERINGIKTFTYVTMPDCFEKTQIRISDFIPLLTKEPINLDCVYQIKENPESINITCKMPLWFNFELLKNFSNPLLPSSQKSEEIKNDSVKAEEKPAVLDMNQQPSL